MASSRNIRQPVVDATLVRTLEAKFGKQLMREGYTGVPVLVQRYYRFVPGNARYACEYDYHPLYKSWIPNLETKRMVCEESHMTPTEFAIMCDIWSYWWYGESQPWPAIGEIAAHVDKSVRQVRRYLQRMQESGWMLVITQYNAEGKQISNRYDFTPFLRRLVAYLETIGVLEKPMQQGGEGVISTLERVSERPGRRVSERPPESNESSIDEKEKEESKIRGGDAAKPEKGGDLSPTSPTYSHGERETIGIAEKAPKAETKHTSGNTILESSKQANSEEPARPARAKEEKEEKTSKKPRTFEAMAAALGIATESLEEMGTWLREHSRPEVTPVKLAGIIPQWSRELGNAEPRLVAANITQASKIYQYARLHGLSQTTTEGCFENARLAVRNHPNVQKKMAFFFTSLKLDVLVAVKACRQLPASSPAVFDGYGEPKASRKEPMGPQEFLCLSNEERAAEVRAQKARADQRYTDLGLDRATIMAMDPAARIEAIQEAMKRKGERVWD